MKKRKRVFMVVVGCLALTLFVFPMTASATIYYVAPDGSNSNNGSESSPWLTITYAVSEAFSGDTIKVAAGMYNENVDVNKSLTLQNEGSDKVTVKASDSTDHVFEVTASWVNISGFTVENATGTWGTQTAGIYLGSSVEHCNISNNIATNNSDGICASLSNNTVIGNILSNNFYDIAYW